MDPEHSRAVRSMPLLDPIFAFHVPEVQVAKFPADNVRPLCGEIKERRAPTRTYGLADARQWRNCGGRRGCGRIFAYMSIAAA